MGTTGAAMLLIRPLLRANAHRRYKVHSVVFFIFMVANIGGSLTPLGDPPLFLGFLRGVPFFWTASHLLPITVLMVLLLLALYFVIESILYAREGKPEGPASRGAASGGSGKFGLEGKVNLLLLACIVGAVLMSGTGWQPGTREIYHVTIDYKNTLRDVILLCIAGLSWVLTRRETRVLNNFTWAPILEVGKLFFGIFLSMIPAIAILQAGEQGVLAPVIRLVSEAGQPVNYMYFWLTGALSSFLDNAPTYVVFFNTAGGNVTQLTGELATTLAAISAGAVFMGANTYIGNAPNFMVRSIAENQGVKMPSFFGYMLWSLCILIPCFVLLTFLFFM
jgi:Na+/H+ antiporter NhaD/arsenite permease-like protein